MAMMMNGKGRPRPGGPKEPLGWQTDALGNVGGDNPYNPTSRIIQPFQPGQQGLLASQLDAGFGGGVPQWSGVLDQWTSPMRMRKPFVYGKEYDPKGGADGDLSKADMAIAQPWIRTQGNFNNMGQQVDFQRLDPKIQAWLREQWAKGMKQNG